MIWHVICTIFQIACNQGLNQSMASVLQEITKINPTAVEFPGDTDEFPITDDDYTEEDEIIQSEKIFSDLNLANTEPVPFTINILEIIKRSAINLVLPFINGMMLGFGEILAHEVGFRYNWTGARVQPPRRVEKQRLQSSFL